MKLRISLSDLTLPSGIIVVFESEALVSASRRLRSKA